MSSIKVFFYIIFFIAIVLYSCDDSSSSKKISGIEIYKTKCVLCHGADGRMGLNGAKALPDSQLDEHERVNIILNGKNIMPSFRKTLSYEEIKAVAAFTMTLK